MDALTATVVFMGVIVLMLMFSVMSLEGRVKRLERRVSGPQPNELGASMSAAPSTGVPAGPPSTAEAPSEAVRSLLASGQKIPAIKQYRIETGAGLREAKEAVEAFERQGFGVNA